jgi:hypothetical protein
MAGILASVATVSVRGHIGTARSTEAVGMLGEMRKGVMASNHNLWTEGDGATLRAGEQAKGFGGPLGLPGGLFAPKKDADKGASSGSSASSGSGSSDKVNKDAALDNDGDNGHGNSPDNCDPSNPGRSKDCDATSGDDAAADSGSSSGSSDKVNKDAALDNDGNNGHGNNEGKCDPSNPGNSKDCDGGSDGGDTGGSDTGGGSDSGSGSATGGGSDDGATGGGSDAGSDDGGDDGGDAGSADADGSPAPGPSFEAMGNERVCGSSSAVPAEFASVKGKAFAAGSAAWSTGDKRNGWKCLNVSGPTGPIHYQFGYERGSSRVGPSSGVLPSGATEANAFTGWARGDVDGDGRQSWFVLHGAVIDGQAYVAPGIEIIDEGE